MSRQIIMVAGWLMAFAPAAWAHSFNVVMVVPDGLTQGVRDDMAVAFLVASEERDGHANEESDGHLGGLDVYITLAALGESARIGAADPDILALPLAGDARAGDAVILRAMDAGSPQAAGFLNGAAGVGSRLSRIVSPPARGGLRGPRPLPPIWPRVALIWPCGSCRVSMSAPNWRRC